MTPATINLHEQWVHLVILVMAILQPLIVLLLILGLILATAHLLTMLGTRWGDRKTSPKSLAFSLGMHVLLGGALIAMIPDYRARIYAEIAFVDQVPIELVPPPLDKALEGATHHLSGNVPVWERLPETVPADKPQFHMRDVQLDEPEPIVPMLSSEIPSAPTEDRADLLPESRPVPQQEQIAEFGALREAVTQMQAESVEREQRPEPLPATIERQRSELPNPGIEESSSEPRPVLGSVDRLAPTPETKTDPGSLTTLTAPAASARRAENANENKPVEGPAPADTTAELVGRDAAPSESPAAASGSNQNKLTRAPLGNPLPSESLSPAQPYRPNVRPTMPKYTEGAPQSSVSSFNELTPSTKLSPQLARIDDGQQPQAAGGQIPATYTLRTEEQRQLAILKYGGSEKSEAAVDRALAWLASVQEPEGHWSAGRHGAGIGGQDENKQDRGDTGLNSDVGVTALAVLSFLGKANTLTQGKYSANVNRALHWIVDQQQSLDWTTLSFSFEQPIYSPGYLGGRAKFLEAMYCHAMATFAIGEAYAMSRESPEAQWLLPPLEKAVQFILDTQIADGSWRYLKGHPYGDMSVFGWQLMALKSAETAGVSIPAETRLGLAKFLKWSQRGRYGGLAAYHPSVAFYPRNPKLKPEEPDKRQPPDQFPTPAMTAEALFCRQMLGLATNEQMTRESVDFLLRYPPMRTDMNFYYWYYGTLAMHQVGGREWDTWNVAVRDLLISEQTTSGELAGSWEPRDVWGPYGGRIYSTAIATLTLEVYYRYLPLYRLNER